MPNDKLQSLKAEFQTILEADRIANEKEDQNHQESGYCDDIDSFIDFLVNKINNQENIKYYCSYRDLDKKFEILVDVLYHNNLQDSTENNNLYYRQTIKDFINNLTSADEEDLKDLLPHDCEKELVLRLSSELLKYMEERRINFISF